MQDADLSFYGQYHSSTIYSRFFRSYQNPKLDSLMEEARSVLDVGKRTSLYSQVQRVLMDDCPDLYCYAIEDVYGINNRIEWQPRTDEYVFYKTMSLAKR
jgi:peptide/nickel transport system substrate-binding protein